MRRNCNLELRLFPSSVASLSSAETSQGRRSHHEMREESSASGSGARASASASVSASPHNQHQQLTIFYNGRLCVCDVTELQARAIILLARREIEDRIKTPTGSEQASPTLQSQLYSPTGGLSMKRSLQRFLQKRKNRILAASPYH